MRLVHLFLFFVLYVFALSTPASAQSPDEFSITSPPQPFRSPYGNVYSPYRTPWGSRYGQMDPFRRGGRYGERERYDRFDRPYGGYGSFERYGEGRFNNLLGVEGTQMNTLQVPFNEQVLGLEGYNNNLISTGNTDNILTGTNDVQWLRNKVIRMNPVLLDENEDIYKNFNEIKDLDLLKKHNAYSTSISTPSSLDNFEVYAFEDEEKDIVDFDENDFEILGGKGGIGGGKYGIPIGIIGGFGGKGGGIGDKKGGGVGIQAIPVVFGGGKYGGGGYGHGGHGGGKKGPSLPPPPPKKGQSVGFLIPVPYAVPQTVKPQVSQPQYIHVATPTYVSSGKKSSGLSGLSDFSGLSSFENTGNVLGGYGDSTLSYSKMGF